MRQLANAVLIRAFMREFGSAARQETKVYLTGGATAVLEGWRASTIDIDLKLVPETDELLREIPRLKESLRVNVELAAPDQFIPALEGWQERSPFLGREGKVSFHHYDLYAQALAKLERGHRQDLEDVSQMLERKLIRPRELLEGFAKIEPFLYRYPAIDPATFRKSVESAISA